jgi:integrase
MIFKPEGRRFYTIKFKFEGQLIQRRTKATSRKAARDIEATLRSELAKGNWGILTPRKPLTLADFLKKDFLPFCETCFASKPNSASYYSYAVDQLCRSDLAKLHLDEITSQHAAGFIAKHSEYSPSTINCSLRTLRRALNLAAQWGKLEKAPKFELARGERHRDRVVSEAEFLCYRALCPQPWRDMVTLIYGSGMRPGEIYPLRWEHVLLNGTGGLIQIAEGKTKAARRMLPMVAEVYHMLLDRSEAQGRPAEGWVFPSSLPTPQWMR